MYTRLTFDAVCLKTGKQKNSTSFIGKNVTPPRNLEQLIDYSATNQTIYATTLSSCSSISSIHFLLLSNVPARTHHDTSHGSDSDSQIDIEYEIHG